MLKRKQICAITLLSALLFFTYAYVPASAANYKAMGVKTGVTAAYQYRVTTLPGDDRLNAYYETVVGTNATILITSYYLNGTVDNSYTRSGNISLYTTIFEQNLRTFVVAANLSEGDLVASGAPNMRFNGSATMTIAGTSRTVLNYNFIQAGLRSDMYYDRITGITVKASLYMGGGNWQNITLISTTAWSTPTSTAEPTNPLLLVGIGIGGLIVGAAIGLVLGRRK